MSLLVLHTKLLQLTMIEVCGKLDCTPRCTESRRAGVVPGGVVPGVFFAVLRARVWCARLWCQSFPEVFQEHKWQASKLTQPKAASQIERNRTGRIT